MLKIGIVTGSATAESLDLVTDAERLGVDFVMYFSVDFRADLTMDICVDFCSGL